jgi:Ala-tRNA(Pro) deacylase
MTLSPKVHDFLRESNVPYWVFPHPAALKVREGAGATLGAETNWAKTIICIADGQPIQALVPADMEIDLERVAALAGATTVRLARQEELEWLFPDCEIGATPPLGPLYGQAVLVDEILAYEEEIVFNGGTHCDAICMRFEDFASLVNPIIGPIARFAIH